MEVANSLNVYFISFTSRQGHDQDNNSYSLIEVHSCDRDNCKGLGTIREKLLLEEYVNSNSFGPNSLSTMSIRPAVFSALVLISLFACQKNTSDFSNSGNFITYRHDLNVGASASDLLNSSRYRSVVVELQYLSDEFKPDSNAVNHFKTFLEQRLNKPDGISVVSSQIKPSNVSFGLDQIKSIEETSRTRFTRGTELAVYVLYLNGYYVSDSLVLGAAYRNTSIVVFGKSINDFSGGDSLKRLVFETTVLEHESGHILGLVDEGTPMKSDHRDVANGNHCTNTDCLMYYAVMDGYNSAQYAGGLASVPVIDSACLVDLRANGGK